jgi:hypothetical protein
MAETIAETLLGGLEDWLQKVESTKGHVEMNSIAVNALFNHIAIIVQVIGTDAECWKEVAEFSNRQSGRYSSEAIHGCLNVLNQVAKLFAM